jgi:pimeloyl-ACP methyl ester carboxylesterase
VSACLLGLLAAPAKAQEAIRPIPPPGVAVPAADEAELQAGVTTLGHEIDALPTQIKPGLRELIPDVQIYYNAVRYALTYHEFFNPREIGAAKVLLREGEERAAALRDGKAPWTTQTGPVVRGYVSRIDGSVQPYGLVIPASYSPTAPVRYRLDFWYHGRGENLSEVNFLADRERSMGDFAPANTIVLHPYGRYCNANRFAGEVDTFEALENARKHYAIDPDRISVRGFSMGGAACWQYGVHYSADWAAVAPGAGFTETTEFLNLKAEKTPTPWYQEKLWHLYDSKDYAENLFNTSTVAYSGEIDGQRQAANVMAKALADLGITLSQVIGPKAGHFYEAHAKLEVARRIDALANLGRNPMPKHIRFTTWTLRYNRMGWISLDGLEHHWERTHVDAEIADDHTVRVATRNVTGLTLSIDPGLCTLDMSRKPDVILDGQKLAAPSPLSDRSWMVHFRKTGGKWSVVDSVDDGTLRKRPGLQGPIDDAFMDSFVMITPTGTPMNPAIGTWTSAEQAHAITAWRAQYRGEARVKTDTEVTDEDIANSNLVLWGDPSSNKVLAKIAGMLPVKWDAQGVHVGTENYDAGRYVPVLVYPNPLNPKRYVVLNSGFTFREYDYLNNARQSPKLPDWAVIDTSVPANPRTPGGVTNAGFFDEAWQLMPKR